MYHRLLALTALLAIAARSAAFTLPDQGGAGWPERIASVSHGCTYCLLHAAAAAALAFRDTMVKVGPWWTEALSTWHCPTPAGSSNGTCDPCAQKAW